MNVPFGYVLGLAGLLFGLGAVGALVRRNLILVLLSVEVMVNAAALAFVGGALRWQALDGQAFAFFLLAVAATEVSVGLAIVVVAFRGKRSFDPSAYDLLK